MFIRQLSAYDEHMCIKPPVHMYLRKTIWVCPVCHTGWKVIHNDDNWSADPRQWAKLPKWYTRYMIWKASHNS